MDGDINKLIILRKLIEEGWNSGDSGKTVLDLLEELKEKYNSK